MTGVLTWAAEVINGIRRDASHTTFFMDRYGLSTRM